MEKTLSHHTLLSGVESCSIEESDKVSHKPPFPQAKQPQLTLLSTPFTSSVALLGHTFPHLNVLLEVEDAELNTGLELGHHSCTEGQSLPWSCWPHYF